MNEKFDSNFQLNFWDLTFLRNFKWDEIMTERIHSYASQNHDISNNSLMAKKMCHLFLKKIKKLKIMISMKQKYSIKFKRNIKNDKKTTINHCKFVKSIVSLNYFNILKNKKDHVVFSYKTMHKLMGLKTLTTKH